MRLKSLMLSLAAVGMSSAPVAASAAPAANPAASLSLPHSARAGSPTAHSNGLAEGAGGIFAAIIVAGIIAIGVIAATNDDSPKSP